MPQGKQAKDIQYVFENLMQVPVISLKLTGATSFLVFTSPSHMALGKATPDEQTHPSQ